MVSDQKSDRREDRQMYGGSFDCDRLKNRKMKAA